MTDDRATEWREIAGYEGFYSVSNAGRVRRDLGGPSSVAGRVLAVRIGTRGYAYVDLSRRNEVHRFSVHRLVAVAFIGRPPPAEPQVNHRNGDKADNRPENLEWCSAAENIRHAERTGLTRHASQPGASNGRAVLSTEQVAKILSLKGTATQRRIAAQFGVGKSAIARIHRGLTWADRTAGHPPREEG